MNRLYYIQLNNYFHFHMLYKYSHLFLHQQYILYILHHIFYIFFEYNQFLLEYNNQFYSFCNNSFYLLHHIQYIFPIHLKIHLILLVHKLSFDLKLFQNLKLFWRYTNYQNNYFSLHHHNHLHRKKNNFVYYNLNYHFLLYLKFEMFLPIHCY